jgi:hypothetical protein
MTTSGADATTSRPTVAIAAVVRADASPRRPPTAGTTMGAWQNRLVCTIDRVVARYAPRPQETGEAR